MIKSLFWILCYQERRVSVFISHRIESVFSGCPTFQWKHVYKLLIFVNCAGLLRNFMVSMLHKVKISGKHYVWGASLHQICIMMFSFSGSFQFVLDKWGINSKQRFLCFWFKEAIKVCQDNWVILDEFLEVLKHKQRCCWSKYVIVYLIAKPVVKVHVVQTL